MLYIIIAYIIYYIYIKNIQYIIYKWTFLSKNTRVDCHILLHIFLTQGLNLHLLGLLHCQVDSLLLSHLD